MDLLQPLYHSTTRKGYVHYSNGSYWFLFRDFLGMLQIDDWSMLAIHRDEMRFYKFWGAPPHYDAFDYATVHDDATLILYTKWTPAYGTIDHLDFDLMLNPSVIEYKLSSSPPDDDFAYRQSRFASSHPNYPPSPPPGGAALADGAESILSSPSSPSMPLLLPVAALALPLHDTTHNTLNLWTLLATEPTQVLEEQETPAAYPIYGPSTMESARTLLQGMFGTPKPNPSVSPNKRVAGIVIADALNQELCCAITLNPLTKENAVCVAPCYHVFEKEAITKWLETSTTCPECRQSCCI